MEHSLNPSVEPMTAEEPPLPSMTEVAGFIALALPFIVVMGSVRIDTVGDAARVTYRDWLAIISGSIGVLGGVLSVHGLRAMSRRRAVRAVMALVLVVVGTFHVARGIGWIGPGAKLRAEQSGQYDGVSARQ